VWHVDKCKITFKLVINWTNENLQHIVVSSGFSRHGIIDARARYRAAARRLRNTVLGVSPLTKYFYDVKRMLIYVMETTGYIVGSNKVSNLRENAHSDDTSRVGDNW